ncbi:MAG: hypothetical protein J3R72DRAFT_491418 [Linnemannia gamsii]|nr:MAG: hypothetical protein J3R72DRAFT_491418 [Linnemannia gamsii]
MLKRQDALLRPQDTFSIPELLDRVGSRLLPPDLLSCIQVNKRWNAHLIPLLWETIDDSQYSWRRFLEDNNRGKDHTVLPSVEDLLGRVLRMYGRFIRHLRIHFPIVIDVVYLSGACTNLLTLEVFDLLPPTTIRTQMEVGKLRQCGVNSLATGDINSMFAILSDEQPIPTMFQNVFVAPSPDFKPNSQDTHDRLTVQRFWLLVHQNAHCLCKLRLDRSLNIMARIASVDFLQDMILSLRRLNDFENYSELINVGEFLDRLPHLQTLVTPSFFLPVNAIDITKTTPLKLRSLSLSGQLLTRGFFAILGGLPGLESLRVMGLSWDNVTDQDINKIMDGTPSNLHTLEFLFSGIQLVPTEDRILRWLPRLHKLKALQIVALTASDLVKFCPLLEDELLKYPWAATNLEVFRVQIVRVPRLSVEQQGRFERAMEKAALSETLTNLGYEYRQVNWRTERHPRMVMFEGKEYIGYGGPIYDTLEFSLDAGLTALGGLKGLEVLGFEGANHCIGEKELDWMAASWPRLKAVRGLQVDILKRAKPDRRRDELREYMVSIRPDVQHRRA